MYSMIGTLPDLAFAAGKQAQFCEAPKAAHWNTVKRVLWYVDGTRDMKICFTGSNQLDVCGSSDLDLDGDTKDRKSPRGYLFMMAGGVTSWCSRNHSVVATST